MRAFPAAMALAVVACSAGAAPHAGVTPVPAAPLPSPRSPAALALTAADVGLPLVASRDNVSAAEAAAAEPDQADAVPLFNSWGWVAESTRGFGSVDETVLVVLRPAGAEDAFAYFAEAAATAPLAAGACPSSLAGLDQCALSTGGGHAILVGRVGVSVFELDTTRGDVVALAAVEAARLGS